MCFTWQSGNELAYRFQAISVFLLLFSSFMFSFLFSYCSLVLFLIYSLSFFNFLSHSLISCDSGFSSNNSNSWASVWVLMDINFFKHFLSNCGFLRCRKVLICDGFMVMHSYNNDKNEKISGTKNSEHSAHCNGRFLCRYCTTNIDKLDWNGNVIVILICKIVPSSSDGCDFEIPFQKLKVSIWQGSGKYLI